MQHIGVVVDNEFKHDNRVVNECKILINNGFKVTVLCFDFGGKEPRENFRGIDVVRVSIRLKLKNILFAINNSLPVYDWFWAKHIRKFIEEYTIDHLHTHDLYMSKPAHLGTKGAGVKYSLDLHENYPYAVKGYKWMHKFPHRLLAQPGKYERIEEKLLTYPESIVVLSNHFKNELQLKYPSLQQKNFLVYPNVPDVDLFKNFERKEVEYKKENSFVLFYFGVVAERRGIFTCLEALKLLSPEMKDIKLLIIGPVDKAEKAHFFQEISRADLKDRIRYYEWRDIALFPSYVDKSDICLSPIVKNEQHESGVANKIFQYMLYEKVLVVSDCAPQKEIVEKHNCGLAFQDRNAEDLAAKIKHLYLNKKLRIEMGKNGKKAVEQYYNTEVAGKELIKIYKHSK